MKTLSVALLLACSLAAHGFAADGFEPLFNGHDLSGWVVEGTKDFKDGSETKPVWTVKDGLINCAGHGFGFLRYDGAQYCDFVLHVEYRMAKNGCNSGIGIRTVKFTGPSETRPSFAAYEVQLQEDAGKPADKHGSYSLYRYVAPTANPTKPAGEWNTVEIQCVGPKIQITANGQLVQDVDQSTNDEIKNKPLCGYVCVQNHGGLLDFRNIEIKNLKPGAVSEKTNAK